jgi:hypothetical protein
MVPWAALPTVLWSGFLVALVVETGPAAVAG